MQVHDIFGFFMGFRKDQVVADSIENILLRGGKNLHQGTSAIAAHCVRSIADTCHLSGAVSALRLACGSVYVIGVSENACGCGCMRSCMCVCVGGGHMWGVGVWVYVRAFPCVCA